MDCATTHYWPTKWTWNGKRYQRQCIHCSFIDVMDEEQSMELRELTGQLMEKVDNQESIVVRGSCNT